MIIGVGTDVLQISRIEKLLKKYGNLLVARILHKKEQDKLLILPAKKHASFLAKRFAAKEAISKALGTGIGRLAFKDIVISNGPSGKPVAEVDFQKLGIKACNIALSLSDDYPTAIAFAVASIRNS